MPLTLKNILQLPSLKDAKILNGQKQLNVEVTSPMIMEALDIESWGQPGQILLTSYFAFENKEEQILDDFFTKAQKIEIAAFVFKKQRLMDKIPEHFILNCRKYQIPLIQVEENIYYEHIISDILETITNRNAFLLKKYYENHQRFIQLMMNQPTISKILFTLKDLIDAPVSLRIQPDHKIIGTDEKYNNFILAKKPTTIKKAHLNLEYQQEYVQYTQKQEASFDTLLSIPIPNLDYKKYELLIHQSDFSLEDFKLMAIKNAVIAIQTELVKREALRQNNQHRLNEMASDLIYGRIENKDDIQELIHRLELDPSLNYRVIIYNFKQKERKKLNETTLNRFVDILANLSKNEFPGLVYITHQKKLILLVPMVSLSITAVKNKLRNILAQNSNNKTYKALIEFITISEEVSIYELSKGYQQTINTYKVLQLLENKTKIASYEDIGIYRLFIETENTEILEDFVSHKIKTLKEENPALLKTLENFIDTNQSYAETAKVLYVHPKTVRYRIDQLKNTYQINFENLEEMLNHSISIRILKVLN